MANKKYKRMTSAEKKFRKEWRADLREQGVIPPVKQRMNRQKFLKETFEEFDRFERYTDLACLYEAISWMVSRNQEKGITAEQVGVLKMLNIAVAIKDFNDQKRVAGEYQYELGELYEKVIQPIKSL